MIIIINNDKICKNFIIMKISHFFNFFQLYELVRYIYSNNFIF